MKKVITVFFALCLLIIGLSGCTENTGNKPRKQENKNELIDNTYVDGFPIVKEKETLKIMTTKLPQHGDFDTMSFTTYYEEMTNIDIEWVLVTPEDMDNTVTLALATGNLPDVISLVDSRLGISNVLKYGTNGTFIKLNDLIEKYGHNIKKMFKDYPETKLAATAADGNIYALPSADMRTDSQLRFPAKLYIRQTWLDNLNLPVPKTAEEFYNVLVAFKKDDPNGNGQADEIPFVMAGIQDAYFGSWGVSFNMNEKGFCVNDDGKVEFGYATTACKNALNYLRRLKDQELIEQLPDTKWRNRIRSGLVGVFYGLDKYVMAGDELGEEYKMIAPFAAGDGSRPVTSVSNRVKPYSYVITSACKNPSAALRWVDYLYSTEGTVLSTWGAVGDLIFKNNVGLYQVKDRQIDRFTTTPGYVIPYLYTDAFSDSFYSDDSPRDKELLNDVKNIYFGKYEPKNEIGVINFDERALEVYDTYYNPIRTYALEMINKFANGDMNVETGWEAYIQELNKKGLKDLLAEYQRLYDQQHKE